MKIVADDKIPFLRGALEPYAEVVYMPGKEINHETLRDAQALLIRTRTKCSESLLKGTSVKFIGTATIGYDHIDTDYCDKNNIIWTNAPGCNSSSVQQYVAAALMKISSDHQFDLKNKTLGIIGVGNVGSKVEKFARAIGMKVLLNDPPRERKEGKNSFDSLGTVISGSDIITLHVPLNITGEDATWHMFDKNILASVKQGAYVFNSSRGEVIDTSSLKEAIASGRLAGAVIDVWENEPEIDLELMRQALVSTPHIAGYSTDGKANGTAMVVNSLCNFFHLPPDNWYPENVPDPRIPVFSIDCTGKSEQDVIREAVVHTYSIDDDSLRLRNSPSDFEKLRGDYPLRREFTSFMIELKNGSEEISHILENMGFKVN
jgi:erythronate-4-phosphate dehydrogenase